MTSKDTNPAAALAEEGQAALDAAKDHLAALERAAAQGLDVSASDFNTAVTEVDLKTRRQAFLNKAHSAESVTYLVALFDAAERLTTAAQADVEAIQTMLDRAKRLAADIKDNATRESHGAAVTLGLPLVQDTGDQDGELATHTHLMGLQARGTNGALLRLNGRVFDRRGENTTSNFTRAHRG